MAFYEKQGDRLVRKIPFKKGYYTIDIHRQTTGKNWSLWVDYDNWHYTDVFKTQREAKEFGVVFTHGFDAGLSYADSKQEKKE